MINVNWPSLALVFVFISMRMFGVFAFKNVGPLYLHSRRLASSKAISQTVVRAASVSLGENLQNIEIPKEASSKIKPKKKRKKEPRPEEEVNPDEGSLADPEPTKIEKKKKKNDDKSSQRFISSSSLSSADTESIAFSISGEPMALARHRSTRFGTMYNPCTAFQKRFLELAKPYLPASPYAGPLEARMLFHLGRPKSQYYSGKNSNVRRPGTSKWHTSRSGTDSLVCLIGSLLTYFLLNHCH